MPSSLRIAMVSEHASPLAAPGGADSGGQNVHVLELGRALGALGHDVIVYTRRDDPDTPDEVPVAPGLRVRPLTAGPVAVLPKDDLVPHLPALTDELARHWVGEEPDVVHAHFWMSGLAALAAAASHIPVVATFHALGSVERRHRGRADPSPPGRIDAERAIARAAARVVATCCDEVEELVRLGVPRRQVTVVPCGVDPLLFDRDGPVAARDSAPRLLHLGRLVRRKGVDDVIAALRRLPGVELVVAGGSDGRDPDRDRLRAVATRCGVADRVRFLGPVSRADVPALLRSADAVTCVPWYEPFGIVPLEAMACGRPVVGTAVGGIQDTVVDGVTGVLVPPRHPHALVRALQAVLGSPTNREAFGIAGRDRVLARYDWSRVAEATVAVYRGALGQPAAPVGTAPHSGRADPDQLDGGPDAIDGHRDPGPRPAGQVVGAPTG